MRKTLRLFFAALFASAFFAGGCHSSSTADVTTTPNEVAGVDPIANPWPLTAIADPNAIAMIRVNVGALRTAGSYADVLRTLLPDLANDRSERATAARSIFEATQEALASIARLDVPSQPGILIARGQFAEGTLAHFATLAPELVPVQRGPFTVYRDDGVAGVQVGTHTIVVGTPPDVDAAIDRMLTLHPVDALGTGRLAGVVDRPSFDGSSIGLAALLDAPSLRALGLDLPEEVAASIRSATGRVNAVDGLDARLVLGVDTAESATAIVEWANRSLAPVRRAPMLRMLGLADLVDAFAVRANGPSVEASYSLSAQRVAAVMQQAGSLIGMIRAMD